MIRFHVKTKDATITTEWQDEPITHGAGPQTAVVAMTELRREHPDAAISIERTTVIPKPEQNQARFKIRLPNNETRYSKVVNESEADKLLAELREKFPKAEVGRG